LPSGLRTSNPVRQTQPRSGMFAGSSRSERAESHPLRQKNKRPLHGAFCSSSRVQLRMRILFDQSPAADWPRSAAGASESHSMANNFKLESTAEIRRFRELPNVWRVIQSETILRASRT
jgi:hypothetical protein